MDVLKKIINKITRASVGKVVLLKYNKKNDEMSYKTREIVFDAERDFSSLLNDIKTCYLDNDRGVLRNKEISDFENEYLSHKIYKIESDNNLLQDNFSKLLEAIDNCDNEDKPIDYKKGYAINLSINKKQIYFISIATPFKVFKHTFLKSASNYKIFEKPLLHFQIKFDIIVIGKSIYIFNDKIERLLNLERNYKIKSIEVSKIIEESNFINDKEIMKDVVSNCQRMCIKFNATVFENMRVSTEMREEIAREIDISLDENKNFIIKTEEEGKKLLEIFCNKTMKSLGDGNLYRVSNPEKVRD
jgi:hypothetical protein